MYKLFILFSLFSTLLFSKTLLIDSQKYYETKDYLQYSLAKTTKEPIISLSQKKWNKDKKKFNNLKNWEKAYWIKLAIKNSSKDKKKYYLQIENELIFHIEFFLTKNNEIIEYIEDGLSIKYSEHRLYDNHALVPVELESNESAIFFIKIKNFNKRDINFKLVNEKYLFKFYQQYNFLEALFFGAMLIMGIYTLLSYLMLRLKIQLHFAIYIFASIFYFFGLLGYVDNYIPIIKPFYLISYGILFISLTLFIKELLYLKNVVPKIDKSLNFFNLFFVIITIFYFYSVQTQNFFYAQLIINIFFFILFLYLLLLLSMIYILIFTHKNNYLKKFFITWMISVTGLTLFMISNINISKIDLPVHYMLQVISLVETIVFSYLLARYIKEKNQKEKNLIQKSKLTSMNEMLTLISHQWRQPLSAINGIVLSMDMDKRKKLLNNESFENYLNEIEYKTAHLSQTIEKYKIFFGKEQKIQHFQLQDVIEQSRENVEFSLSTTLNIKYVDKSKINFNTSKSELIQIFIILFSNSSDAAIKNFKHTQIKITSTFIKDNIILVIEDNGGGIEESLHYQIFNPYFTTKQNSEGVGLGLYILNFIVQNSLNGKVSVCNSTNGSIFTLTFPIP